MRDMFGPAQYSKDILVGFWDFIWFIIVGFLFIAYLIVLFSIVGDLFRDHKLNGWWKALWVVFLIFVPFLTSLVYLIARGRGMAERQQAAASDAKRDTDAYIKTVVASSPADEIAKAKALLDSGAITQDEYDHLKGVALAR